MLHIVNQLHSNFSVTKTHVFSVATSVGGTLFELDLGRVYSMYGRGYPVEGAPAYKKGVLL